MIDTSLDTGTFAGAYADWGFYSDMYNQGTGVAQNILIESDVTLVIAEDV